MSTLQFYEVTGDDLRPRYRATLTAAHEQAKCLRPYASVRIEVVEFAADKAAIEALLAAIFEPDSLPQPTKRTGRGYLLTNRGGLRQVDVLPVD